jgi:hypothetical protein
MSGGAPHAAPPGMDQLFVRVPPLRKLAEVPSSMNNAGFNSTMTGLVDNAPSKRRGHRSVANAACLFFRGELLSDLEGLHGGYLHVGFDAGAFPVRLRDRVDRSRKRRPIMK